MASDSGQPDPIADAATPGGKPPGPPLWRAKLEHNALWLSLGALALAGAIVAVGIQVAPETFYDRFWWEDIYGPLVVDARQCHTAASCPGLEGPPGISVKDGYTVTSELTYGLVLAVLLYGIYVGLFRRFGIIADGWFVLGLLPWIMLGPLARVLEDANVFCQPGTNCEPGAFAYLFISPVIYVHIALYVIPALLLGVYIRNNRHKDPLRLTAIIGAVLAVGFVVYLAIGITYARGFSALVPWPFVLASCLAALALFHWRAKNGLASVNLTAFVLGIPFALGCIYLIVRWLSGDVWAPAAWNGEYFRLAGAFILTMAALVAAVVFAASRALHRSGLGTKWAAIASHVPERVMKMLGRWGGIALVVGLLLAGILPAFTPLVQDIPSRETLIPILMLGGLALLIAFAFVHVGREEARFPGAVLVWSVGINVALVFAHMVDGLATWVALEDPIGFGIPPYSEKHPFSEFLLRYWNGFLFPFTKLMMVLVVGWMLARETRETAAKESEGTQGAREPGSEPGSPSAASPDAPVAPATPDAPVVVSPPTAATLDAQNMVGLVLMAIFVLGFAPGLRDVLRLTMGV